MQFQLPNKFVNIRPPVYMYIQHTRLYWVKTSHLVLTLPMLCGPSMRKQQNVKVYITVKYETDNFQKPIYVLDQLMFSLNPFLFLTYKKYVLT